MSRAFRLLIVLVGGVGLGAVSFLVWAPDRSSPNPPVTEAINTTTTTSSTTTTATTAPSTTTATLPPRGWLVIQGTGDVAVDPGYIPVLAEEGWDHAWSGLDGLFLQDDLTVINLECAPSDIGSPSDKKFVFRCPTEALPSVKANGIEVANLGNNHSGDFGKEALVDGRANLISAGIAPVGAGMDVHEAGRAALFEINGWRIAVVGFGGVAPGESWYATEDRPGMRSGDHIDEMVEAVAAAAEAADIVVVTIHWGVELDTQPRADDIARAEAMIEAGADIIFGHHPHRLQPLDFIEGSAVFWSLGNFVWPHNSIPSATTAVARAVVSPDGRIEACLIPAFIETHGHPVLTGDPPCGPGS
jgi:poly-gamma-glutamate capsule biosynthesis protein CapA/YwtB (metallophosphatase superfamily)